MREIIIFPHMIDLIEFAEFAGPVTEVFTMPVAADRLSNLLDKFEKVRRLTRKTCVNA